MDLAEVVVRDVDRHGVRVVLDLLGEAIGKAREAAHVHPHREVLALHDGRRDERRIGRARDIDPVHRSQPRRAVAHGIGSRNVSEVCRRNCCHGRPQRAPNH